MSFLGHLFGGGAAPAVAAPPPPPPPPPPPSISTPSVQLAGSASAAAQRAAVAGAAASGFAGTVESSPQGTGAPATAAKTLLGAAVLCFAVLLAAPTQACDYAAD